MSTWGVDAPYSNEIWSVIPRLSAMRSNCSMVGLSFPQLILFRYCLVQPNLRASSASLMHFSTNAFFKSIFVSFFISLWARHSQGKARKKDTPSISESILSNYFLIKLLSFNSYGGMSFFIQSHPYTSRRGCQNMHALSLTYHLG